MGQRDKSTGPACLLRIHLRLRLLRDRDLCQPVLVGIANDLCDARKPGQLLGRPLRVTAGHDNLRLRILAMHTTDCGPRILIRGCRHGAGVQDNNRGFVNRRSAFQAAFFELVLDGGTVRLGRSAPKILYVKTCHRTIVAAQTGALDTPPQKLKSRTQARLSTCRNCMWFKDPRIFR